MSPTSGTSGNLSLFPSPSTSKPPSRKNTPNLRTGTPQTTSQQRNPSFEMSPQRNGRQTPENASETVLGSSPTAQAASQAARSRPSEDQSRPSLSARPPQEVPPRSETAFSEATLVQGSSSTPANATSNNPFRSSIAKLPLEDDTTSAAPPAPEAGLRSIFPQYDHTLPLDRQQYFPTQTSPRHIPREAISRTSHVPGGSDGRSPQPPQQQGFAASPGPVSPMSANSEQARRWPRRRQEAPPPTPPTSKTDRLRDYWKAANGWKASSLEGRKYGMRLAPPDRDAAPAYTLSSAQDQPFYHMRLDPTSASAHISLSRHDPAKPCRELQPAVRTTGSGRSSPSGGGILGALRDTAGADKGNGSGSSGGAWQEVIATTLEDPSRRLPPEDGLVALIYPSAAARMALDRPQDVQMVATAERECARLVWDEDSANYFLSHPALAAPFCVAVERYPAFGGRTEYTLEHVESPEHLARLVRSSDGEGHLEVDTLVASGVEAHYILDVAVCALLVVARLDEKNVLVEQFDPPPMPPLPAHLREGDASRSSSRLSGVLGLGKKSEDGGGRKTPGGKRSRSRLQEFELDIESQSGSSGGVGKFSKKTRERERERDKLPGTTRTVIKLLSFGFKCIIWALTIAFKALTAMVVGLSKCITSEKL